MTWEINSEVNQSCGFVNTEWHVKVNKLKIHGRHKRMS